MKHLPGPHQTVHANYGEITAFLKEEVDRHMADWNPEDPRDYIDTYLVEMEKVRWPYICKSVEFTLIQETGITAHARRKTSAWDGV